MVFHYNLQAQLLLLVPQQSKIKGNYPNPFNPVTNIVFDLAELNAGNVEIAVYDIKVEK